MMRYVTSLLFGVILLTGLGAALLAHEETYKGTVIAVEAAKIQVRVIDETSKKETATDFGVTAKTKIFRGDKTVTFAAARIQKDERIAVTINHDAPGRDATVIRLAAAK